MDNVEIARKYHEIIDLMAAEALSALKETGIGPACRKGCAWCCRLVVNATAPEGELAAEYIKDKFDEKDKGELIERIRGWLAWYRQGRSASERVECPFLNSELCSIYDVRPMGCRVHYSEDADSCRRALDGASLFYEPPLIEEVLEAAKPLCIEFRKKLEDDGVCFEDCVQPLPELVLKYLVEK